MLVADPGAAVNGRHVGPGLGRAARPCHIVGYRCQAWRQALPGPAALAPPRGFGTSAAKAHATTMERAVKINRRQFALATGGIVLTGSGVLAGLSIAGL